MRKANGCPHCPSKLLRRRSTLRNKLADATLSLMRLIVKATNITLTPAMVQYLTDKLSDVARLLKRVGTRTRLYPGGRDVLEARVEVGKSTRHHKKGPYFYA